MSTCPITGTAEATALDGIGFEFTRTDPEIHVSDAVLANNTACGLLELYYEIGEPCPHQPDARHARLKATA